MDNKNIQDVLFEYLRNVIYSPEKASLDVESLPTEFQDLGEGLVFLGQCVKEQKAFGKSLINGDFDSNIPNVENGIAAPLKEVHGILKHLMWQSQEVAKGDYSQTLSYFGQLSESFNSMVNQLREREDNLKQKNHELMNLHEMFKNITVDAPYYIFVINRKDNQIVYLNKKAETLKENCVQLYDIIRKWLTNCYRDKIITIDDKSLNPRPYHYQIMTRSNPKDEILVYMVINVTKEFSRQVALEEIAYKDELTGLHNRRYCQHVMEDLINNKTHFAVSFIDIDHLKYCNDIFGHEKGDEYIAEVSGFLKQIPGDKTICRLGGDEFIVIKPNITSDEFAEEMCNMCLQFKGMYKEPFQKSFSFGVSQWDENEDKDSSKVLSEADTNMYRFKIKHKQNILYKDDRI